MRVFVPRLNGYSSPLTSLLAQDYLILLLSFLLMVPAWRALERLPPRFVVCQRERACARKTEREMEGGREGGREGEGGERVMSQHTRRLATAKRA